MQLSATFKLDGQYNLVQVETRRNDSITDTIDKIIGMGFPADIDWGTLQLWGKPVNARAFLISHALLTHD